MIELTKEQRASAIRTEMRQQLVIMKQYITNEERDLYKAVLKRISSITQYEDILLEHFQAHG